MAAYLLIHYYIYKTKYAGGQDCFCRFIISSSNGPNLRPPGFLIPDEIEGDTPSTQLRMSKISRSKGVITFQEMERKVVSKKRRTGALVNYDINTSGLDFERVI